MKTTARKDLVFPELSYEIIGCAFEVYNEVGGGHKENVYQKAMSIAFQKKNLLFQEQLYFPIKFKGNLVGKNFFDFNVEEKIIVELKARTRFSKADYEQVLEYLNDKKFKLALLINFTLNEVVCKRVTNFNAVDSKFRNNSISVSNE